jgi:hypothetical protein
METCEDKKAFCMVEYPKENKCNEIVLRQDSTFMTLTSFNVRTQLNLSSLGPIFRKATRKSLKG